MDLNSNNTDISLFPAPPKFYTNFVKEDSMAPPDLTFVEKMSSFMTFGKEYKTNEKNAFTSPIDFNLIRQYEGQAGNLLKNKPIPNGNIFQPGMTNLDSLLVENLNVDIFDAIEKEIKFLKTTYKELLDQITKLENFEMNSCLIKFSLQKIYFFISLLKKKKIYIEIISYFRKEIENNTEIENTLGKNLEKCQNELQEGLRRIKDDILGGDLK